MRDLNIREKCSSAAQMLNGDDGQLVAAPAKKRMPSNVDFRASLPKQMIPSEVLIAEDRDRFPGGDIANLR